MDENEKDKITLLASQENAADADSIMECQEAKKSFGRKILVYIKPWLNIKFLMTYGLV